MTAILWKRTFFVSIWTKQIHGKQCTVCPKIINSTIMTTPVELVLKVQKPCEEHCFICYVLYVVSKSLVYGCKSCSRWEKKFSTPICRFIILKELPFENFLCVSLTSLIDAICNGGLCQPHHLPSRYRQISSGTLFQVTRLLSSTVMDVLDSDSSALFETCVIHWTEVR
jgi:hypothetical protein